MKTISGPRRLALCVGGVVALAASAQAGITDPGLVISASNASGSGEFVVFLSNGTWSKGGTEWSWTAPSGGYDIFDPNTFNLIAHVSEMSCNMVADPQVSVNFNVSATASTTHFAITTGVLSFPSAINSGAMGRASAGVTITDGDGDGATLTGLFGGNGYRANYNGTIPSGSIFTHLLSGPLTAPADDTATYSAAYPAVGYVPIGGVISSMQAKFDFDLSANDTVSGTSFYEIVPAPASLTLLWAGMIGFARRRRS